MNWNGIIASVCLGLAGCTQTATQTTTTLQKDITTASEAEMRVELNFQPVKWPLTFKEHSFSARCFDTLKCSVWYAGLEYGDDKPSPPSSHYKPNYLDKWLGGHGGIHNFPEPADLTWRSRDGTEHQAEIDIAAIFSDELVRHKVRRDDMAEQPDGLLIIDPSILLEVNDRTVRVYMRPWVPLNRKIDVAGQMLNDIDERPVLVKTYNY